MVHPQEPAVHVLDRNGPSSEASFVDTVCADCGMC